MRLNSAGRDVLDVTGLVVWVMLGGAGNYFGLGRLTFNSKNYSFLVPLHSSFVTFRFSSGALGQPGSGKGS